VAAAILTLIPSVIYWVAALRTGRGMEVEYLLSGTSEDPCLNFSEAVCTETAGGESDPSALASSGSDGRGMLVDDVGHESCTWGREPWGGAIQCNGMNFSLWLSYIMWL
jgi:hypothetical protein